jgi:hypothetical protein
MAANSTEPHSNLNVAISVYVIVLTGSTLSFHFGMQSNGCAIHTYCSKRALKFNNL